MKILRLRIALYIIAFVATFAITYLLKTDGAADKTDTRTMSEAGLPVVYMVSEEGMGYNYLYGYNSEINYSELHGVITPVKTTRDIHFALKTYGTDISGISYEVRDLSGTELIEKTELENFTDKSGIIDINARLRNLLETGKEYMLKICINTKDYGDSSYYTRIKLTDNANVDRKLSYVKWFSGNTRNENTLKELIPKLEPDSTGDNTDLSHVNIHSKLSQVGYGMLNPELQGEIYPQIDEIDGDVASITLKFCITTKDENRNYNYEVTEFFRINQVSEKVTYVYSYDRFMNQIFEPEYGISSGRNIYLGINEDKSLQTMCNSTGTVTAFVVNGNLWSYHPNRDKFNKVFSFDEETSDGFREKNRNYGIKILDVDKNGDIYFVVYGYMNRGSHEGNTGIAAYMYNFASNTITELAFIPTDENYLVTKEELDKVAYINDKKILYFYRNRSIYYLNYETKECMLLDSNVVPDTCMTSGNNVLVYQTENVDNLINIIDLKDGVKRTIQCETNEKIRVLGFIDNNIVYGLAPEDIVIQTGKFLMKGIYIMDENLKIIRTYENNDSYISGTEFYESKIIIKRVAYDENNNLVDITDERLLSNTESDSTKVKLYTGNSEERQKELYIIPPVKGSVKTSWQNGKYVFPSDSAVHINNEFDITTEYYYVYTYGRLYYIDTDKSECISVAKNTGGVVIDLQGNKIWDRYMDDHK